MFKKKSRRFVEVERRSITVMVTRDDDEFLSSSKKQKTDKNRKFKYFELYLSRYIDVDIDIDR
mgnify:CR=1 FL=1